MVKYEINVEEYGGNLEELNIVMVLDIYIGTIIGKGKVDKMVKSINEHIDESEIVQAKVKFTK